MRIGKNRKNGRCFYALLFFSLNFFLVMIIWMLSTCFDAFSWCFLMVTFNFYCSNKIASPSLEITHSPVKIMQPAFFTCRQLPPFQERTKAIFR